MSASRRAPLSSYAEKHARVHVSGRPSCTQNSWWEE
jgi:hypothetical protein